MAKIKFDHSQKTFSGAMGISEKRWNELCEATKQPLAMESSTPRAIEATVKSLKKVSETDLVIIGYIIGAYNMKYNIMGGGLKEALLKSLLG